MTELEELKDQISMLYGMVNAQRHLLISLVMHSDNIESVLSDFDEIHKSNYNFSHFEPFTDKELEYLEVCYKHLIDYVKKVHPKLQEEKYPSHQQKD